MDQASVTELNYAIIGCGRISGKHVEAIEQTENATLVAVCDIKEDRAKELGEKAGVPWYTDMDQMVDELGDRVNIVSILTESGYHAEHAIRMARKGKHVVVEKPMALTVDDADQMIWECEKAQVKLFVIKQNRFNPPIQEMRRQLDDGHFGKMVSGAVRVRWCRPQAYYDQDPWRGTWSLDGGVFSNQASHHIDLLIWMMGPVETVYAKTATRLVDIECEDTGMAILKFRSGAIGVIEATTGARPKNLEGSLSLLGEKGSMEVGGFAVNEVTFAQFQKEDGEIYGLDNAEDVGEVPPNVYGFGHVKYYAHIRDVMLNNAPSFVDGWEGRKSLEVINAMYESSETGREVALRFQPKLCRLGRKL